MGDDSAPFEKLLDVVEKYVEAWAKAYNKIEEVSKDIDRLIEKVEDLNNIIRQKPCITETVQYAQLETVISAQLESILKKIKTIEDDAKDTSTVEKNITLWLKLGTGAVMLIGTVLGIILAFVK